jgi:hypothetical protein
MRKRKYGKHLKLVAENGRAVDEMFTFDGDLELDEALEQIVGQLRARPDLTKERAHALIQAWLADLSKAVRQ